MTVAAILTDIEGTTSSISFVHDVLFPYAREKLPAFVREHRDDPATARLLDAVRAEAGEPDAAEDRVVAILTGWIDEDRKATPLKSLQGMIWKHGYENGDFTGHVYADAAAGLAAWKDAGIDLYVYSSGSTDAQKLLFRHSDAGDLRPLFSGYFDTRTGKKREVASYRKIADAIGRPAAEILFLSDVAGELDAARAAGMRTAQLVRGGDVVRGDHPVARDFTEVVLD